MVQYLAALFLLFIPSVSASSNLPVYNFDPISVSIQPTCTFYKLITLTVGATTRTVVTCATPQEVLVNSTGDVSQVEFQTKLLLSWSDRSIAAFPPQKTQELVFEKIPHATEITYTKSLPNKKKIVVQKGKDGRRGQIIENTITSDGKEVSTVISSWIENEPITEQIHIGTIHDYKTAIVNGKAIQYWRTLTVRATSYDSTCAGCNHTTATGAYLKKGVIAVDPRVIPMHTKMYVPGYGFGQAEDTGGAVKGNRIDLAFDDIRKGNWSRRDVMIYILD